MNIDERLGYLQPFVRAFNGYGNGILPEPGGLMDQPATFVEAASVLEAELARIEREMVDEASKRAAK